jgi:hypothetical protein
MSTINILGIDIGKSTFHLVGHDLSGREVCRKKFSRPKLIQFSLYLRDNNYRYGGLWWLSLVSKKVPRVWA